MGACRLFFLGQESKMRLSSVVGPESLGYRRPTTRAIGAYTLILMWAIILVDIFDSVRRRYVGVSVFRQYYTNKEPYYLIVGRVPDEADGFSFRFPSIFQIIDRRRDVLVAHRQMIGDARSRQYIDFLEI
jgi:hypothetical protein